jgi:hypothetical protein
MPPLPVYRKRLREFFATAVKYAEEVLTGGGSIVVLSEYTPGERRADFIITIEGAQIAPGPEPLVASLRRAIVDVHGGSFEISTGPTSVTLAVSLPDPVGRDIDAWIPGFEVFSEHAKQILRLLRSGGPVPPEEVLLAGVLDEELERWLLPRLTHSTTQFVVQDLVANNRGLPGTSPERLKKALDQVKRGKPRREITRPPYAAELLYAFRGTEQHREAIGAGKLSQEELETLCRSLLESPCAHVRCLRLVAKARNP